MKVSYVFFADGFEEVEALTCVDVMRRAGMHVVTVSINPVLEVTGAHGVARLLRFVLRHHWCWHRWVSSAIVRPCAIPAWRILKER